MKVTRTDYGNNKEILKYPDHYVGMAVMVSDAGVSAGTDGRKIVPAGTLVGNSASGAVSAVNSSTSEGVLLSNTDVTHGNAPASMIIHGFINKEKIPAQPSAGALTALNMIKFL